MKVLNVVLKIGSSLQCGIFLECIINCSTCCLRSFGLDANKVQLIMVYIRNDTFVLQKYATCITKIL